MAEHTRLQIEAGLQIYFCDPRLPWQRDTDESTNSLLRQYCPKRTDLGTQRPDGLAAVGSAFNCRPRKILGWKTPAKALDAILRSDHAVVATIN